MTLDKKQRDRLGDNLWNKIRRYGKRNLLHMMQRQINLTKEISRLGNKKDYIRADAALKLGISHDKRAIRPLLEALKDRNWDVKVAAAEALGEIGDPRVLEDVRKLLTSVEREIKKIESQINNLMKKIKKLRERGGYYGIKQYSRERDDLKLKMEKMLSYPKRLRRVLDDLKEKKFSQLAVLTESKLKEMDWQDFQDRIIEALNGVSSDKKVADMGIDGITSDGIPIQVKQSENVGRNVVDNFETALRRYYPSTKKILKGIIVAFSFTKGAYEEAYRARLEDNIKIDLMAVEELFD